ncbi:hypothetical protein ACFIJ5_16710 [Haloimpatiens sp. FM7330]|uniref:hypothetical protein n=1 Tax=Haloimpatiens sp. FM7330 TaxID=3298610 RepID=UPI0036439345
MLGTILDINKTDAFINLQDGTTMDISISKLPRNSKIGDTINIPIDTPTSINNKSIKFFI